MCCRFRCPGPGVFQCALTGLVFVMAEEAELLYNTVQWDDSLLQSAGKMAAGPLFKIKSSEEAAVCQLHLPHCETKEGKDIFVFGVKEIINETAKICFHVLYYKLKLAAFSDLPKRIAMEH